ncbi:HAD-IA family hydrolase [Corynebacterium sp.]|uniref:HAD family hydrolase n=1 Tax=Corynebacterium sp. TaxID=1720 RepID=UPI0025C4EB79|nr:HAD-IA family hydrolase [Corynebacterium sp.]
MPDLRTFDAVLFDLDGVITPTADLHRAAWAAMFTEFLGNRGADPYTEQDYYDHLDGRSRDEGVQALLDSRGISLPHGDAATATASDDTVVGLGLRKNEDFLRVLGQGIDPYPGSVALLDDLTGDTAGTAPQVAIVSSSKNARQVLTAAGLVDRFGLIVDGTVAAAEGLPGKPAPDTYLFAARSLGVDPSRAVVVEDATSGVASGRAGDFGLVVGVDRGAGRETLLDAGADIVVSDLAELTTDESGDNAR